jgi:tetratricopeptide (TPR) repeat protein
MVAIDQQPGTPERRTQEGQNLSMRTCAFPLLVLCMVLASIGAAIARAATCAESSGQTAVAACQQLLDTNPTDIGARLKLADTLIALRHYQDAVHVLNQGVVIYPGSDELERRLAVARSLLEEQQWIEKQRATQPTRGDKRATATRLNVIRCGTLKGERALAACDAGLEALPDDVALLTGRGDALFDLDRVPEAMRAYRSALSQNPGSADIQTKLKAAEAKRLVMVASCLRLSGSAALAACEAGLLKGEQDEATIQSRRGELLAQMGQTDAALEAYRTAEVLDPSNSDHARAIARLTAPKQVVIQKAPHEPTVASIPRVSESKRPVQPDTAPALPAAEPAQSQDRAGATAAVMERQRVYSNAPLSPGVTF